MPRHLWAYSSLLLFLLACQKDPEVVEPVRNDPSPQGYIVSQVGESFPEVNETANCYVLKPGDGIQFPLVKGCSAFSVGTARSAAVLWESAGSSSAPLRSSVVSGLALSGNKLQVRAGSQEGNAVVAVYDAEAQILWSWHIWVTSALPEDNAQVYAHGAGTVMDRNLGALSAEPGSVAALGLLYQWGRKDPFPGSAAVDRALEPGSTVAFPAAVSARELNEELLSNYATAHPTTFIAGAPATRDWYATSPEGQWSGLWGQPGVKSIADPCPAGWMVAPYDLWVQARIVNSLGTGFFGQWDDAHHGLQLGPAYCGANAWFPAAGLRHPDDGKLYAVGDSGYLWTCQSNGQDAVRQHYFQYSIGDHQYARTYLTLPAARAAAQSVRCIKL